MEAMKKHDEITFQRELLVEASRWENVGMIHRLQSGLFFTSNGTPIRVGFEGLSDVCGIRKDGRAFYLELKAPNGTVTREQHHFLEVVRDTNGLAGVARSIEEAKRIIDG